MAKTKVVVESARAWLATLKCLDCLPNVPKTIASGLDFHVHTSGPQGGFKVVELKVNKKPHDTRLQEIKGSVLARVKVPVVKLGLLNALDVTQVEEKKDKALKVSEEARLG